MRARYVDLPLAALPHAILNPEVWPIDRGREINIDPHPVHLNGKFCEGPFFGFIPRVLHENGRWELYVCIHIIELDESQLEAEIEAIWTKNSLPSL